MEFIVGGLIVLVLGVFAATWLGCAAWVYRDARRRNLDSAAYWGVGLLFTGYVGFVVYVLAQGSSRSAALSGSTE